MCFLLTISYSTRTELKNGFQFYRKGTAENINRAKLTRLSTNEAVYDDKDPKDQNCIWDFHRGVAIDRATTF